MPTKRVVIRYREFDDPVGATNGATLETALREALNTRENNVPIGKRWAKRIRRDPSDQQEHMVANHVRDGGNYVFGNLVAYTLGRDQAVLVENSSAQEADIQQLPAPAQKQFVNSMMFWMVTDNHVFVLRHGQLNPPDLEIYLRWLLAERTAVCNGTLQVILNETISIATAGIRQEDIKSVKIGGQISAHPPADEDQAATRRERRRVQRAGGIDFARKILNVIVGNNDEAVERILRAVPDGVDLSVDVEIGFDTTKHKFSRDALKRVATATRNLPDSDIQLVTPSGVISGDQIRLTHTVAVPLVGSLLERDHVLAAMIEAYSRFVRSGKIEPSDLELAEA